MLVKSNFLQSKYYIFFIALLAILIQPSNVYANKSCDYRVFNIKTSDKVTSLELLSQLADSCDFSLVIKDNFAADLVKKELYGVNIKNMTLEEIFDLLISDNDLYYEYNKNFLKISALQTRTFKVDYITSVRQGTANIDASVDIKVTEGDTTTAATGNGDNVITSNDTFDFWGTVQNEILSMMNTGEEDYVAKAPIVNQNAGLITVTGTKNQLDRVATYIDDLQDRLHKQVLIDVSIYSVLLNNANERGINWSKFNLNLTHDSSFTNSASNTAQDQTPISSNLVFNNTIVTSTEAAFSVAGLIDFLDTNGVTKVVSSPKVLTMNNQPAIITVGDNINYRIAQQTDNTDTNSVTVTYNNYSIFVGVLLNITPEITNDGQIILRINPSVSSLKNESDLSTNSIREIAPDTKERKLSTVVKVHNGNTIILGGLIARSVSNDRSHVPVLGDIPIFGEAFKYKGTSEATTELVFVITPRLIGPKDDTKATLKDLGFSKKIYE
ncbi:pilus (MSHA type) biogenesis protein MshL [Sulfurospirillum sp. 1307]